MSSPEPSETKENKPFSSAKQEEVRKKTQPITQPRFTRSTISRKAARQEWRPAVTRIGDPLLAKQERRPPQAFAIQQLL